MKNYLVWYSEGDEDDLCFACQAHDEDEAREKCWKSHPKADIQKVDRQ